MKTLFFGSHQYSLIVLEALKKAGINIVGVISQPDRPIGRHQIITPTPVKSWALTHNIPVLTPEKIDRSFLKVLSSSWPEIDLAILCIYGEMVPKDILVFPKHGFLNLHPSLLPKYRGASPVAGAIVSADKQTGITILKMDEKLDHGPILLQEKYPINDKDTADILYPRLFQIGSEKLIEVIKGKKFSGSKNFRFQDENKASYTRQLTRQDGFIPWEFVQAAIDGKNLRQKIKINFIKDNAGKSPLLSAMPAGRQVNCSLLNDLIRGLSPWPGAWTIFKEKRLKLLRSHLENNRIVLDLVQFEGEKINEFKKIIN